MIYCATGFLVLGQVIFFKTCMASWSENCKTLPFSSPQTLSMYKEKKGRQATKCIYVCTCDVSVCGLCLISSPKISWYHQKLWAEKVGKKSIFIIKLIIKSKIKVSQLSVLPFNTATGQKLSPLPGWPFHGIAQAKKKPAKWQRLKKMAILKSRGNSKSHPWHSFYRPKTQGRHLGKPVPVAVSRGTNNWSKTIST